MREEHAYLVLGTCQGKIKCSPEDINGRDFVQMSGFL